MEQEQKLKEHHTVESPGGQKVYISMKEKKSAFVCVCYLDVSSYVHYNFLVLLTIP
jgi:hypothetical protein